MDHPSPLEAVFFAALEKRSPRERAAYLDEACAGDPNLRRNVEKLLAAQAEAGSFLEAPAVCAATTVGFSAVCEMAGTEIGPYKLLEPIGEGGFGVVFLAEQQQPVRRKVALKVVKPGMDTRQVIARFEAERQALALMDHPNIAQVHDGGTTPDGRPYFVMELVKGIPITDYCDQCGLSARERLELFLSVCQAVQHAHQKGVIHRDIKPSNVLVAIQDRKPMVKVIDFGVAKAINQRLSEHTVQTGFHQMIGTPLYMSPEQAELSPLDVDTRADIYALGVLLYELLTGTTPLEKERLSKASYDELRRIIREEEPPRPSARLSTLKERLATVAVQRRTDPRHLLRTVRGELDWIVMKALEKDRNRRYETASAFAQDVQRYLADEPVQACPPSAWYRLGKFARRHRLPLAAGMAIAAAVLLGLALSLWQMRRAMEAEAQARHNEEQAVRERKEKANALVAEAKARQAARQTRDRALSALRDLTGDLVGNELARAPYLTEENKELLRKLIKHYEGLARISGDDADSRQIRAEAYARVGLMRHRLGELKEAEAAYTAALGILKQLVADFPNHPEFRHELAITYNKLGKLLSDICPREEAEVAYTAALGILKQLVADFPKHPEFRHELAITYNNLGILYRAMGRLKEAEAVYTAALGILKQLVADFPTRPEFRQDLGQSHNNLGILLHETGRLQEAENAFTAALELQKQLAADFPNQPDLRNELASTLLNLALLAIHRGDFAPAMQHLKEAEPHHQAALKANPRHPQYREFYRNHLSALARTQAGLGKREEAGATSEQIAQLGWDQALDAYRAALALASCIPIVDKDEKLAVVERQAAAEFYAERAVAYLEQAVAAGWRNPPLHATFAPLRQREDFKKLLAELEAKKN